MKSDVNVAAKGKVCLTSLSGPWKNITTVILRASENDGISWVCDKGDFWIFNRDILRAVEEKNLYAGGWPT